MKQAAFRIPRKIFVLAMMFLLLLFSLMACSEPATSSAEPQGKAELVIDITAAGQKDVFVKEVELVSGDTPISLLEHMECSYEVKESTYGSFVFAIDGVAQGEFGSASGWLYFVNDGYVSESAQNYQVKDGDVIKWQYSTGEESK